MKCLSPSAKGRSAVIFEKVKPRLGFLCISHILLIILLFIFSFPVDDVPYDCQEGFNASRCVSCDI